MANAEHLEILKGGVKVWNEWKNKNQNIRPDLSKADLRGYDLRKADLSKTDIFSAKLRGANLSKVYLNGSDLYKADLRETNLKKANLPGVILHETNIIEADLSEANLSKADLSRANLCRAKLCGANLCEANLSWTDLSGANLSEAKLLLADLYKVEMCHANLTKANLSGANLTEANLSGANLREAGFRMATLVKTTIEGAILNGCMIYGISVWDLIGEPKEQKDLIITPPDQPEVTVDNIKVAQFIYLLLENEEIRDVIDTLTSKSVLILGRFSAERKKILDNMKDSLRAKGYLPILFDFEKPASRDLTETIKTLASLSKFIIADITDAKSIPQELSEIVKDFPSIPVQPLILESQQEYAMFERFRRYPWVLDIYQYPSSDVLLANLENAVIAPAERKVVELKP